MNLISGESVIRLGFFSGVLLLMAVWEMLAPRRRLTTAKPLRWFSNLGLVVLDTLSVRLLLPLFPNQIKIIGPWLLALAICSKVNSIVSATCFFGCRIAAATAACGRNASSGDPFCGPAQRASVPPPGGAHSSGQSESGSSDEIYRELLHRLRAEHEQLGQVIDEPF